MKTFLSFLVCIALAFGPATSAGAQTHVVRKVTIPGYYGLGVVNEANGIGDHEAANLLRDTFKEWKLPLVQVAWFGRSERFAEPVLLLVGEISKTEGVMLIRPQNDEHAAWLKDALAYPTTPADLTAAFAENSVLAEDNFKQKSVIFEAVAGEVARGAFNKPYVFFPVASNSDTGLTCYFEPTDGNLRKIRKGTKVIARGDVKQYLMNDVILEYCTILAILP